MIGIFDSGIGGFTVARELRRQAPQVDLVYFGDVAHAPYGEKDQETLERLTIKALKFLRAQGATHLLSACNSVSCSVILPMLDLFGNRGSRITEMVQPAAAALVRLAPKRLTIIATPATVRSGMYETELAKFGIKPTMIAVPRLAGLIEQGAPEEEILAIIRPMVQGIKASNPDVLMLGCTHYPFVIDLLRHELDTAGLQRTMIFDPASAVAQAALAVHGSTGTGAAKIFTSKTTETFTSKAEELMHQIPQEQKI
jgi:glutamate racemase